MLLLCRTCYKQPCNSNKTEVLAIGNHVVTVICYHIFTAVLYFCVFFRLENGFVNSIIHTPTTIKHRYMISATQDEQ